MPAFPSLSSGAITQLPFTKTRAFRTTQVVMPYGGQFSWKNRTMPLRSWTISLTCITDAEVETLLTFIALVKGSLNQFDFHDPDSDTDHVVRFDQDVFNIKRLGPDQNAIDLLITEFAQ